MLNVKLHLFALIAKQPAFHQLRSVEQLGYITALLQRHETNSNDLSLNFMPHVVIFFLNYLPILF